MPLLHVETANVDIKTKRKQSNNSNATVFTSTETVGYNSLVTILRDFMATPELRGDLQTQVDEVGDDVPVLKFNQTPIFRELRRWTGLMDFYHKGEQYSLGDVVILEDESLARIEGLFYEKSYIDQPVTELNLLDKQPSLHLRGRALKRQGRRGTGNTVVLSRNVVTRPVDLVSGKVGLVFLLYSALLCFF